MDGGHCRIGTGRGQADASRPLAVRDVLVPVALALPATLGLHGPALDEAVAPVELPALVDVVGHGVVEQR
eukprot:10983095-Alexandrium_andersonii.AAC.1